MDSMYDFPMFEHDIHDTNQKLRYYRNIVSFLGELKTLQSAMCTSCREKCGSSPATGTGGQSVSTPNDLSLELRPLKRDAPVLPRIAEMDTLCRTPQASSPVSPPIDETTIPNSVVEISTERSIGSNHPTFYARRDDLAGTTLDVEFVHSFSDEKKYRSSVCFSRDGSYLAVATAEHDEGSIVIYDVEDRAKYWPVTNRIKGCVIERIDSELREYATQYGSYKRPGIWSLCFSANGRYVAARDFYCRIIVRQTDAMIRSIFEGHNPYVSEILFSPDGRLIAFCDAIGLLVFNVRDNSMQRVSECSRFDFSPDGRHIATGNRSGHLAILDLRTCKAVKKWNGHGTQVFRVIFTSDGKGLLCLYIGVAEHWDLNEADPILIWKSDTESYLYAISPDNRLLACSNELRDVNGIHIGRAQPRHCFRRFQRCWDIFRIRRVR